MRGVETRIQEIRRRIFCEVARMAYHTEWPTDRAARCWLRMAVWIRTLRS